MSSEGANLFNLIDRKAAVRRGRGCVPNIEMYFRLSHDPALGLFTFTSGNWSFAEQAIKAKAALASAFMRCWWLMLLVTQGALSSRENAAC
jgi:hypothetical protein